MPLKLRHGKLTRPGSSVLARILRWIRTSVLPEHATRARAPRIRVRHAGAISHAGTSTGDKDRPRAIVPLRHGRPAVRATDIIARRATWSRSEATLGRRCRQCDSQDLACLQRSLRALGPYMTTRRRLAEAVSLKGKHIACMCAAYESVFRLEHAVERIGAYLITRALSPANDAGSGYRKHRKRNQEALRKNSAVRRLSVCGWRESGQPHMTHGWLGVCQRQ